MEKCIHPDCPNRPEWEHAIIYSGKQVNEVWSIVPCCKYHHRGKGLIKDYNVYHALKRLFEFSEDYIKFQLKKYPKNNWLQRYKSLRKKYERY